MNLHENAELVLKMFETWIQALSDPQHFLATSFQPTDVQMVSGIEFYAFLFILSILLGAPLVLAQKGDVADKTRLVAHGVFGVLSVSVLALTWHVSFWMLGGKSSFAGTYLAYVYAAAPYIPLTSLAIWIVASGFPRHLLVYWTNPAMAKHGLAQAKNDPGTATGMFVLGGLVTYGITLWGLIVALRSFSYVHAMSGWRLLGAILLSGVIAIPVSAVLNRMGTMLQPEGAGSKTLARRVIEEILNKGNLEVANESFGEDAVVHDPAIPDAKPGPEGAKEFARIYRGAFPDLHIDIDDQVGEGDLVVSRWTLTGTQQGVFGDIAATNRRVSVKGITIYRFYKGKIAEGWMNWDALGLLQQLGLGGEGADGAPKQLSEQRDVDAGPQAQKSPEPSAS